MHISAESKKYSLNKETFFRKAPLQDSSDTDSLISISSFKDHASSLCTKDAMSNHDAPTRLPTEHTSVKSFRTQNIRMRQSRRQSRDPPSRIQRFFTCGELELELDETCLPPFVERIREPDAPTGLFSSFSKLLSCFGSCSK